MVELFKYLKNNNPYLRNFSVTGFLCLLLILLAVIPVKAAEPVVPISNRSPSIKFSITGFNLAEIAGETGELAISATVPLNHHAYLDKGKKGFFIPLKFDYTEIESAGYKLSLNKKPAGEYDKEVEATVLRGKGKFTFYITNIRGGARYIPPLLAQSQICDDITKVCFPPQTVKISLSEDYQTNFSAPPSPASITPAPVEKDIVDMVTDFYNKYSQNFFPAFILIFFAGILSAATPCVYPMLPITSAILKERGGKDKKRRSNHTRVYFLGIICIYIILGYIAGMTGGALNIIMKSSFVNLLLALFFCFFGMSMLGFIEFPLLQSSPSRFSAVMEKRGDLTGTFFMGMTAGLIVSPCVGPVVFTLLLQVADRIAEANAIATQTGGSISFIQRSIIAGRGGILMGGFGIGIGIPFLMVGVFSSRMPKSGTWMEYIKYLLGLVILYIAWIYYLKGTGTAGVPDHAAYAILAGLGALFFSCYLGALCKKKIPLKKTITLILLAAGIYLIYYGLSLTETIIPNRGSQKETITENRIERHGDLEWHRDFEAAKKVARKEKKPIFIDFYADWCANCVEFEKLTLKNKKLNKSLKKAVLVKIYDTDPIFKIFRDNPDHRELKIGLPYFSILLSDGRFFWDGTRYDAVDTISSMIDAALNIRPNLDYTLQGKDNKG